ncbi:hypothetical protein KDX38_03725 [Pseudomonas sp. CDFA 602]|uniref:hypothetical protein n=1 Tax=Pseudomonas californiensis TaxID=2829823 RepID=UPI001E60B632|nr:hypothetical protein [Pseudomonas californiensis]MCD5996847.1 hypothetical protein [Pseudomonas californiensis]MCD5998322.1 hypothetical protein [Pseudomonas californiensis]
MNLYINQLQKKSSFRSSIYAGDIFLNTDLQAPAKLCAFAKESITAAFDGETDHPALHTLMPVEEFVDKVTRLKGQFTNCLEVKELIQRFVLEIGADPDDYLFDVPRIRVVPNYNYLHAGVSYAYKPHRDTWYGGSSAQINTWMPVYTIDPDQTMMINPEYFSKPVSNTSANWDLADWINVQRPLARENVTEEVRVHPVPLEDISTASEIRIAANAGEIITFSGSHLHGTVPNYTDRTRFSIDFRLIHIGDLHAGHGANNVDSGARDSEAGFKDLFHVSDFSQFQGVSQ